MSRRQSWIIIRTSTGAPIAEVWEKETADRVDARYFVVMTALDWLCAFNRAIAMTAEAAAH